MRTHGIRATYVVGCRCEDCTTANAVYMKGHYRARRRVGRCVECNTRVTGTARCQKHRLMCNETRIAREAA